MLRLILPFEEHEPQLVTFPHCLKFHGVRGNGGSFSSLNSLLLLNGLPLQDRRDPLPLG